MTNKIRIEFFHDVICSFCFPMSYNMREIAKKHPEVEIIHRSFALVPTEQTFNAMFGTRENAKQKILSHWQSANTIDELHRFNISGMEKAKFFFPTSIKPLLACMAAQTLGGNKGYWDVFDALQRHLFTNNEDINDMAVIERCISACGLDVDAWRKLFRHRDTLDLLYADFQQAEKYNIISVPSLVINESHLVRGVLSVAEIEEIISSGNSAAVLSH